ncbi:hypothetical protein P7C73_g4552, partial [Tremellales sp. Uapishka_1]
MSSICHLKRRSVCDLPNEVFDMVGKILLARQQCATLASLSLTCKRIQKPTRFRLFHHLHLDNDTQFYKLLSGLIPADRRFPTRTDSRRNGAEHSASWLVESITLHYVPSWSAQHFLKSLYFFLDEIIFPNATTVCFTEDTVASFERQSGRVFADLVLPSGLVYYGYEQDQSPILSLAYLADPEALCIIGPTNALSARTRCPTAEDSLGLLIPRWPNLQTISIHGAAASSLAHRGLYRHMKDIGGGYHELVLRHFYTGKRPPDLAKFARTNFCHLYSEDGYDDYHKREIHMVDFGERDVSDLKAELEGLQRAFSAKRKKNGEVFESHLETEDKIEFFSKGVGCCAMCKGPPHTPLASIICGRTVDKRKKQKAWAFVERKLAERKRGHTGRSDLDKVGELMAGEAIRVEETGWREHSAWILL